MRVWANCLQSAIAVAGNFNAWWGGGGTGRGETRLGMHIVQGCKSFQISRVGCIRVLGEVADGLGPILGGRGLGQQLFYPAWNQKGGRRFWGGCVWVGATCRRREVYLFPQVFCCRVWLGFPTA